MTMIPNSNLCFSPSLPVLKRPRSTQTFAPRTKVDLQRSHAHRKSTIYRIPLRAVSRNDSIATSDPYSPVESALSSGAFTVLLKLKFQKAFAKKDQKAILSEYGRKTCAEEGVLRCDILHEVTSRGLPRNEFYDVWITFADRLAYSEHERSSHASMLRLCLENPSGGDTSVMLTKLAYHVSLFKPLRPDLPSWRSIFDDSSERNDATNKRPFHPETSDSNDAESSAAVRRSLDRLISSVGLENVTVLISTATAKSQDSARKLRACCVEYLTAVEKSAGIVRTGLLVSKNDPFQIMLMTVHDASDEDGACFDMDLGIDFVDANEWSLKRCFAVFPDKIGWEIRANEYDPNAISGKGITVLAPADVESTPKLLKNAKPQVLAETPRPSQTHLPDSATLDQPDQPNPRSPKTRLLQGAGAFESLKHCLREMTRKPVGQLRAMIVHGWNASRIHDLIVQLEYDRRKDSGMIEFKANFIVRSMDVTTERLKTGLAEVRSFRPDVIIGYGGGSVMDMSKAIAQVGNSSEDDLEKFITSIDTAAEDGQHHVSIVTRSASIPLLLIPATIGSGAELSDSCIFSSKPHDGSWRRIPVVFCEDPETEKPFASRTVLVDSRLVSPKRLDGFHASQGALQLVCLGIDVLMSAGEQLNEQYVTFARDGLKVAFKWVIPALREPYNATGHSRDPLVNAKTAIGLARDSQGRVGVCLKLTLGVIDSLIDGRYPTMFRMVLIRITAAVLEELNKLEETTPGIEQFWSLLCNAMKVQGKPEVVLHLLSRAEDCDVVLLREIGMVRRRVPEIAEFVACSFDKPECSSLERLFTNVDRVERVLQSALSQEYEL